MRQALWLRLGVVQAGRVLDERVVRAGDVTVGTAPGSTLVLPSGPGAPGSERLIRWPSGGTPRLVASGRLGRLGRGEAVMDLGAVAPGREAALAVGARAKVSFGDAQILIQTLAATGAAELAWARRARRARGLDWPWLQALLFSAALLGGSGGGLAAWWQDTGRYYDDLLRVERQTEQLATAAVAVRLRREPPPPPPPADASNPAADAVPTPEAGPEVAAVDRVDLSPPTPRPSAARAAKRAPKAPTRDSVGKRTFIGVLGGGGGEALGRLSGSRAYASAFDGTDGGVVVADGGGDLPDRPAPRAAVPARRYVSVCEGGACVGDRLPTGPARPTPQKDDTTEAPVIAVRPERPQPPTGPGIADPVDIGRVFARRKGAIAHCYERYLQRHPGVDGKVTLRFTLGVAGRITAIAAIANTFGDATVSDCIVDKVGGWRFEPPRGGEVTFVYPLVLEVR